MSDPSAFYQLETQIAKLDSQAADAWLAYQDALDEHDALRAHNAPREDRDEHWRHCRTLYQRWQDIEEDYDRAIAKRQRLMREGEALHG